jgi:hypothetical protein
MYKYESCSITLKNKKQPNGHGKDTKFVKYKAKNKSASTGATRKIINLPKL